MDIMKFLSYLLRYSAICFIYIYIYIYMYIYIYIERERYSYIYIVLTIRQIRRSWCKTPRNNTLVCRFLRGIWFDTQRDDETNIQAYVLFQETVTAIRIPYSNTKIKDRLPDEDKDFSKIVAGVLHGDK